MNHALSHPACGAPPARMRQSDGSVYRIHKIQGHTIREIGHKNNSRLIRNQAVNLLIISLPHDSLAPVLPGNPADIGSVGLVRGCHIAGFTAHHLRNAPVIGMHILLPVPPCKAQIHGGELPPADSSQTCGKQILHDTRLLQQRKGQVFQPCTILLHCNANLPHSPGFLIRPKSRWLCRCTMYLKHIRLLCPFSFPRCRQAEPNLCPTAQAFSGKCRPVQTLTGIPMYFTGIPDASCLTRQE